MPDEKAGKDLPDTDGTVADEDVNAITDDGEAKETGKDQSTKDYRKTFPDEGVGGVQNSSDRTSSTARID